MNLPKQLLLHTFLMALGLAFVACSGAIVYNRFNRAEKEQVSDDTYFSAERATLEARGL